jgi:unsaturated chondroitin disaccharide hydrolase
MKIEQTITAESLRKKIEGMFSLSGEKIHALVRGWRPEQGAPVFTVKGKYTARGWTEWTQGFQFGSALLQFDATEDEEYLELGRSQTREFMASHVSHVGVHDHGFNNVSTYGNLRRLILEGKAGEGDEGSCDLALKVSGAVQAARWTKIENDEGFIYSFNGPHSLFIDTMRSLRSLALAHQLGHVLMGEHDERISLLERLIEHGRTTARFSIYYGEGRDAYDLRGRTAHESIFNTNDGRYRCPNSQQGYSPFSTWTRGLAWAICGFAEQLEFLRICPEEEFQRIGGRKGVEEVFLKVATATADFYIENSCACGVPMWDTGAPNLHKLGDYLDKPADPFNDWEPVDSSAAAIAAQGLIRLGNYLRGSRAKRAVPYEYRQAGLNVLNTLLDEPYLSTDPKHQGLLLHSVYHRPNGWDYLHKAQKVPNGESSMWGDYHLREAGLLVLKELREEPYLTFFHPLPKG